MLCGEFHRAPIGLHLNSVFLSGNPSPYCSLLTLVRGMAAITAQAVHEDEDIFLGNDITIDLIHCDHHQHVFIIFPLFEKMTKEDENGIQHIVGNITNDLYAVPMRKCQKNIDQIDTNNSPEKEWDSQNELPPGWEKHEDNDGPYYWHIKSGTIQREIPLVENNKLEKSNSKLNLKDGNLISSFENNLSVTRSSTSSALNLDGDDRKRKEEIALNTHSSQSTPGSKNARGKDLFMDLDEGSLKLFDPENLTVLNTQPIHTIRVWGVGRDNGRERDFAYVARDRTTRKHMCHVFRCDMPARTIANTLRDICKKIMIERSLQQNLGKAIDVNGKSLATRPNNLPTEHRRPARNSQIFVSQSFPTPMEEPKKILRAQYLGSTQVSAATGMDILNESIDRLVAAVPREQWQPVNISIAPSMISIHHPNDERVLAECRVRYLSFLGIGKVIKHCAFIMHTAQDTFVAHVFYCEPSSGALCKTIEAACKLRYQKCLDAHPQGLGNPSTNVHTPGSSIGAALKSIVGSLRGRKSKSTES
uniref:Protein Fe65 homolog n=1 Tax=Diabrotica virgifera virgifera TaxID=50390 RepID=A0A6P7G6F4_DIAVI